MKRFSSGTAFPLFPEGGIRQRLAGARVREAKRWRKQRYHAPSDDLNQPVDLEAAAAFDRLYVRAVEEIANRKTRPRWNDDSFFRRFAKPSDDSAAR